ncbi:hypothetical protein GCM10010968_07250 [Agrococcus terreus]|uniref:Uncharacterized protein n=1 Tax=Agrococcus terreus TaxID=574649 RepID=A0ABQ2KEJ9_9MICO|nr:hypothetical protein GCM10010968_07250 [Agrococcus terreus]
MEDAAAVQGSRNDIGMVCRFRVGARESGPGPAACGAQDYRIRLSVGSVGRDKEKKIRTSSDEDVRFVWLPRTTRPT